MIIRLLSVCLLICFWATAQTDFNNYRPLRSFGQIPEDFIKPTSLKVREDYPKYDDLSRKEARIFVDGVNFEVDELLHSGQVYYGDPVSRYMNEIKNRLLVKDTALRNELRIYTLDTDQANAFSTAQGVIFMTTGLIAQSTSEAQLAFVLAHEIIHYSEKHSLNHYTYTLENRRLNYGEKLRFFTNYSRSNESEADVKGMKLFHEAGYDQSEIYKVFDVLNYSFTPFEEIPVTAEWFTDSLQYINPQWFAGRRMPVPTREYYDDRLSTHPNLVHRLADLQDSAANFANWGDIHSYDRSRFEEIRNICRFQYVMHLFDENRDVEALYSVRVLKREFPESAFLRRAEAQAWLGIIAPPRPKGSGFTMFDLAPDPRQLKFGELYVLDQALALVPQRGKLAMSLRATTNLLKQAPEDTLLRQMWEQNIKIAAHTPVFKLKEFSSQTFREAADSLAKLYESDSIKDNYSAYRDKYDVISGRKKGLKTPYTIDTAQFYIYSISDLISDSAFLNTYQLAKGEVKRKDSTDRAKYLLTDAEYEEVLENERFNRKVTPDSMLILRPQVAEYVKFTRPRIVFSEERSRQYLTVFETAATDLGISTVPIGELRHDFTTADLNDQNTLINAIVTAGEYQDEWGSDRDYLLNASELRQLSEKYGVRYVCWSRVMHNYTSPFSFGAVAVSVLLPPVGLLFFPNALMYAHQTNFQIAVLDLRSGRLILNYEGSSMDPSSPKILENLVRASLTEMKSEHEQD